MKRVTIVFDDDALYRAVKVEAARTGRTVKDIVSEALREHVGAEQKMTPEEARRLQEVLEECDRIRARQRPSSTDIAEDIRAMREERLDNIEGR